MSEIEIEILKNQVVIMEALIDINEISKNIKIDMRQRVLETYNIIIKKQN